MTDPIVTEPGIYDLPEDVYHADVALVPTLGRSLSSSGAKALARGDRTPAHYAHELTHRVSKDTWDVGTVAHALILNNADDRIRVVDAYDWRTKVAQQAKVDGRDAGLVVVHRGQLREAARMASAVRRNPTARDVLDAPGLTEKSIYWIDERTGVTCRGRIDRIASGKALVDIKTSEDASPSGFGRQAWNLGYLQQAAWYVDGWHALTGETLPWVWLVVEKSRPHLVAHYWASHEQLAYGRAQNEEALRIYAECASAGRWPGYSPEIEPLTLPRWAALAVGA